MCRSIGAANGEGATGSHGMGGDKVGIKIEGGCIGEIDITGTGEDRITADHHGAILNSQCGVGSQIHRAVLGKDITGVEIDGEIMSQVDGAVIGQ